MREQIFAEAFEVYRANPSGWWHMTSEALGAATRERENRRVLNVFEGGLSDWLRQYTEVDWATIATGFLKLETPAAWKDKSMQMQVAAALKILGWHSEVRWDEGKSRRLWKKTDARL